MIIRQSCAMPENLFGIDLLEDRVAIARNLNPNINFECGNAETLPYESLCFDIVIQCTMFTSILDPKMKINVANEMIRVLRTDGFIIWYDYHVNNPWNPDVRGIKKNEIAQLFPECKFWMKRITLAPPLASLISPFSFILADLLEKVPFFCTHYIGLIKTI